MPGLLECPDEILIDIIRLASQTKNYSRQRQRNACALSLVCRDLRLLARPFVFRLLEDLYNEEGFKLFIRSLTEAPELRDMVKSAAIAWLQGDLEAESRVFELLAMLPALRTLVIGSMIQEGRSLGVASFLPEFLQQHEMPSLQELTVSIQHQDYRTLSTYLRIKGLRLLHVADVIRNESDPIFDDPGPPSELKALSFHMVTFETFKALLPTMKPIGDDKPQHTHVDDEVDASHSGAGQSSLKIRIAGLEKLSADFFMPAHRAECLDFTHITTLKHLDIPGNVAFGPHDTTKHRLGFYVRMPQGITNIRIRLEISTPLLTDPKGLPKDQNSSEQDQHDKVLSDLAWIVEILERKQSYLPLLRHLSITEYTWDISQPELYDWVPPSSIVNLAQETCVELKIEAHRRSGYKRG